MQKISNGDIEVQKEIGSDSKKLKDYMNEVGEEFIKVKDINRVFRLQLRKV